MIILNIDQILYKKTFLLPFILRIYSLRSAKTNKFAFALA